MNSGEYLRWVRRVEYLCLSEVLSIVSTIKFVDTILQDLAANLKMTLLDAYVVYNITVAKGAKPGVDAVLKKKTAP